MQLVHTQIYLFDDELIKRGMSWRETFEAAWRKILLLPGVPGIKDPILTRARFNYPFSFQKKFTALQFENRK